MSPTAPSVPAGTVLGHSYEYGLDVNVGTVSVPSWQTFRRISDFQPNVTPVTQSAQTYDDFGSPNDDKTGETWGLSFTALANRASSTGLYLPEIEAVLARTLPSAKGESAVLHVRYYHKPESGTPNPADAFEGFATVSVTRANTGADGAVERFNITLTGKGPRTEITNPFTGWAATAPMIASISPSGAASGELVTITGAGFIGTTAVTIDSIAMDDFQVIGGSTIVAILPTDDAGTVNVVVTNAAGPSAAFAYTRAA